MTTFRESIAGITIRIRDQRGEIHEFSARGDQTADPDDDMIVSQVFPGVIVRPFLGTLEISGATAEPGFVLFRLFWFLERSGGFVPLADAKANCCWTYDVELETVRRSVFRLSDLLKKHHCQSKITVFKTIEDVDMVSVTLR